MKSHPGQKNVVTDDAASIADFQLEAVPLTSGPQGKEDGQAQSALGKPSHLLLTPRNVIQVHMHWGTALLFFF